MTKAKKVPVRHLQVRLSPRTYMAIEKARGPMTRQRWALAALEAAAK